jgi:NADH/NAD ratio-sensing transcriptional regulator Rex
MIAEPSVTDVALGIVILGIPALMGLAYRSLVGKLESIDKKQDDHAEIMSGVTEKMGRWDVALFGMTGDNGINGTVKELRRDVDRLMDRRQTLRRAADQ